jgi:hypothetical protein
VHCFTSRFRGNARICRWERALAVIQQIHDQHRMIRHGERRAVGDEEHRCAVSVSSGYSAPSPRGRATFWHLEHL